MMLQRVRNHVLQVCKRPPEPQCVVGSRVLAIHLVQSPVESSKSISHRTKNPAAAQWDAGTGWPLLFFLPPTTRAPPDEEKHITAGTKSDPGARFFPLFIVTATFSLPYLEAFFPRLRLYRIGSMQRIPPHESRICHLIRVTQVGRNRLERGCKVNLQTCTDKVSGATKVFSKSYVRFLTSRLPTPKLDRHLS